MSQAAEVDPLEASGPRTGAQPVPAGAAVSIENVRKDYRDSGGGVVTALEDVSLGIRDNEFFTLLGPSGCGKTTLLRCIAGFEQLSHGRIRLFDEDIESLPPNRRPVNTVFQQYALFPHMSVFDNVAFGPRMLRWPQARVREVCERMLALVKMDHLAGRRPAQLSGGQQQRVALARALASQPKVLLLDEPLSALDLKLRQQMRVELKQLQQETGITFIFVTHDQEEALTMSDRIAVLSEGRLQQVGGPLEIYERPVNRFVADFIGESNFMEVEIESRDQDTMICRVEGGARVAAEAVGDRRVGDRVTLSLRPEKVALHDAGGPDGAGGDRLAGTVERLVYLGTDTQYLVRLPDGSLVRVRVQNAHASTRFAEGEAVSLAFDPGSARILVD